MSEFPPTIVIRHRKENLKKCSLRGLEERSDFLFFRYPLKKVPIIKSYILLTLDADIEISPQDSHHGLLIIDGTWKYAEQMTCNLSFPNTLIKRRLPSILRTTYPRKQTGCSEPDLGLASIEAIAAAYKLMGRDFTDLLDHYHWKEEFLVELRKI